MHPSAAGHPANLTARDMLRMVRYGRLPRKPALCWEKDPRNKRVRLELRRTMAGTRQSGESVCARVQRRFGAVACADLAVHVGDVTLDSAEAEDELL